MALIDKLKSIADAIRTMTGKSEEMTLDAMPEEIKNIKTTKEPYIEETYDEKGNLVDFNLVGDTYTVLRPHLFGECTELNLEKLPDNITRIGHQAFYYCTSLTLSELPANLKELGNYVFKECYKLKLSKLPDGLKGKLGNQLFYKCYDITIKEIPKGIDYVGMAVFSECTSLTEMTFKNKPSRMGTNVFEGCTNLTVINVPWSEGEMTNAPWGAVNATINYDYVEE